MKKRSKQYASVMGALIVLGLASSLYAFRKPGPISSDPVEATIKPRAFLSAEEMLGLPESEIDYGVAALVLTREYVPAYDVEAGDKKLDEIVARVRALVAQQPDHDDPLVRIAAINTVLFREYGFTYDLENFPAQTPDKRLLGNLLRRGRGTCANLPDLYYAVADRLGYPVQMVEAPQHVFLRYSLPDGTHLNIEATSGGSGASDEDYIAEMEIPKTAIDSGSMMRSLSKREALLLLIEEATWHDEWHGNFEGVLARAALLRRLRPNHAATFWNSAVYEIQKGRALRELRGDAAAAQLAEEAFARGRMFAKRAFALGITKPDNSGEYARRQEVISRARSGESGPIPPAQDPWDAAADLEALIARPTSKEPGRLVAVRRPVVVRTQTPGEYAEAFELMQKALRDGRLPPDEDRDPVIQEALDVADAVDRFNRIKGSGAVTPKNAGLPPGLQDTLQFVDLVNGYNQSVGQSKVEALQKLIDHGARQSR